MRVLRRLRRAGHDRPVDQRKERQFVMRGIDADGIAGFQRRALRQKQGQSGHAGLDDGIDVGIAGDDIGEPGLRDGLAWRSRPWLRRPASATAPPAGRQQTNANASAAGAARRRSKPAMPPPSRATTIGVDQEQRQRTPTAGCRAGRAVRHWCSWRAARAGGDVSSGAMRSAAASVFTASGPSAGP